MKTTNRKLQVVLTIVSLTFLVFLTVGNTAAGQRPSLSKKEVKALIASAKTKEDHLKLADYYKAETERLDAAAKDHDEMAEMYRKNPTPLAVKHPEAIGEGHCKEIARRFRESATKTQELAAMHEEMAKEATQ
jgi:hypothetical protein